MSNWWLAADIYQQLLTLPSSTSDFQASVEAYRTRCRLNTLTLIKFPNYGLLPFLVEIRFPKWHKRMDLEDSLEGRISSDELKFSVHLAIYQERKEQVDYRIHSLDEKIDHKANRLLDEIKQLKLEQKYRIKTEEG